MGVAILHIDANRLCRAGLSQTLRDTDFDIKWDAARWTDASVAEPDLVIADFTHSDEAFRPFYRWAQARAVPPKIVLLTDPAPLGFIIRNVANIDGYLTKDMAPNTIVQALNLVQRGQKVFPSDVIRLLTGTHIAGCEFEAHGLSDREIQILTFLRSGFSNKQIANGLSISEGTVKVHLKAVLKKVQVTNRTQAAMWAVQNGVGAA